MNRLARIETTPLAVALSGGINMVDFGTDEGFENLNKVYGFQMINPFPITVGVDIIGSKPRGLSKIPYLNPDEVDPASKISATPMVEGYPVDTTAVPKSICWESKSKALPDVIMSYGVHVVSEKIKDIVEQLEGDVHQFIPVDVYRPKEKIPFAHRYWMVVCRRIDSVDVNKTTFNRHRTGIWESNSGGKIVYNLKAIGSANLWLDPDVIGSLLCSSNLARILKYSNLFGLELRPVDAI